MKMVAKERKDRTMSHNDGKLVICAFLCWRWREQMVQILPDEKSSMVSCTCTSQRGALLSDTLQ